MSIRVLVVDDEPDILDLMTIWLEDDPRCKADFRLGSQTSVTVLPSLRHACPRARILIHTASRDEADAARVLSVGADAILEKATVSIAEVVEAVLAD